MPPSARIPNNAALLRLLQLASPSLPVGAYSYSEGIEFAVEQGAITDSQSLRIWLEDALQQGGARVEATILVRAYDASRDPAKIRYWNAWLTAARESEELRLQNLEMGRSLLRLLAELSPRLPGVDQFLTAPCNFVVAFALAAANWRIAKRDAVVAYLHTWVANLVGAGVKLIPLGQTAGQKLLWELQRPIEQTADAALIVSDDDLAVGNWGQALASMRHETQYSRLFRS